MQNVIAHNKLRANACLNSRTDNRIITLICYELFRHYLFTNFADTTHVQTYMSYETFVIVKVTSDREKVNRKCKVEITSTNIFFLRTKY